MHFWILPQDSGLWRPNGIYPKEECGFRLALTNIVGGKTAKFGDFPYMALLGYRSDLPITGKTDTFYTCGGSLINKWYVLTAAHCIKDSAGEDLPLS